MIFTMRIFLRAFSLANTIGSRSQMFFEIGGLKNFKYSQENTCVGVSF